MRTRALGPCAKRRVGCIVLYGVLGIAAAAPRPAQACGGCFAPSDTVTAVESHRMIISLSVDRTTLWDQIQYSGDPRDFVWVLPVPTESAVVEIADAEFFAAIDQSTAPSVRPANPVRQFCVASGGIGCGAAAADSSAGGEPPADQVTVYNQGTVGPYETATIGSDSAVALHDWLAGHGYAIPDATLPTIQYYVDRRSVFIALRLQPGQGVNAMQPVRVRYPGYMGTFPLKMVTVGAAGALSLTLWVIADQRYGARNYATTTIDARELSWDWSSNRSSYGTVFDAAIGRAGGRAWVVEAAQPLGSLYLPYGEDLTIAQVGVSYPVVTRLRTRMLVDLLDEDLELAPAAEQAFVSADLIAPRETNRPSEPDCDGGAEGACAVGVGQKAGAAGLSLLLGTLAILLLARRRAGRRPPAS